MLERIRTADGATLCCKRKPAGGPSLVFFHGLAVNADIWDIPDLDLSDGGRFRSLAAQLHDRGFDIWLVNLRGCGGPHMLSEPPAGQRDWCVDHFVLHDVDAAIRHIAAIGKPTIAIGQSMGAMSLAAWLQGATWIGGDAVGHIEAIPSVAIERQRLLCGVMLIEMPAALRWPQSLYDEAGNLKWNDLLREWKRTDSDLNFPFELMSRIGWLHTLIEATGDVRLDWIRPGGRFAGEPVGLLQRLGLSHARLESAARMFSERIKGADGFHAETIMHGLVHALERMKSGVLQQLSKSVRQRSFVSAIGTVDHHYAEHYHHIALPLLAVAGGRDRIANAQVIRELLVDRAASRDKEFMLFDPIAHGEFEYSPVAMRVVYPRLIEWIQRRAGE